MLRYKNYDYPVHIYDSGHIIIFKYIIGVITEQTQLTRPQRVVSLTIVSVAQIHSSLAHASAY